MYSLLCLLIVSLCATEFAGVMPDLSSDSPESAAWKKCMTEGGRLYDAGRITEAALVLEKAVHYAERFAALDTRLPSTIHDLAFIYQMQGQYAAATRGYLRAIRLWERLGPSQHSALSTSVDNLIGTYVENHEYRAAKKLMAWRLPEMERSATKWKERAILLNMQAGLAQVEHRYDEAEGLFRQSEALWKQHVPDENRNLAVVLMNLSTVFAVTKRYQEAYDLDLQALALLEKLDPTVGALIVRAFTQAGQCTSKLRRPVDAERYYQRALTEARQVFGPQHPTSGQIMLSYSSVLRALERNSEAKSMAREARAIIEAGQGTVDILELKQAR
jgi:tetratricopeptide (TPR) repeat protein